MILKEVLFSIILICSHESGVNDSRMDSCVKKWYSCNMFSTGTTEEKYRKCQQKFNAPNVNISQSCML